MIGKIADFIVKNELLDRKRLYLTTLSGGADSVAMLLVLKELGYNVQAIHCNFNLRGEESDGDEQFCKDLCQRLGVALHVAHFDTLTYAGLHGVSIEMAARALRYRYFFQLARDLDAGGVCIAHHQNDQAETILMNLVRGTGIHGLSGMKPMKAFDFEGSTVNVIRPMLAVSREEILAFLGERKQPYVIDSSNLKDNVVRNKLRLRVLPLLKEINPSVIKNITETGSRIGEAEKIFDNAIRESIGRVTLGDGTNRIDIARLLKEVSPEYTLFCILQSYGFTSGQVCQIYGRLDAPSGRIWESEAFALLIDRGTIIIEKKDGFIETDFKMPEPGTYIIGGNVRIRVARELWSRGKVVPRTDSEAVVDAKTVVFPLTLRNVRQGDTFVPFGMNGKKLVSDFLTNQKKNLFEKRRQWVLCDRSGNVLWLVGNRTDNRYRVDSETTEVLRLTLSPENSPK